MRGFFFTMAAFVILLYISIIASHQTASLIEMAKSYAEVGDVLSFTALITPFGEANMERTISSLAYYALNRMAEHAAEGHYLKEGGDDGIAYADDALLALMREGRSEHFSAPLVYNESERRQATLRGLKDRFNELLSSTPYRIERLDIELKNMSFKDYGHLNLSTRVSVAIEGPRGGIIYSKPVDVIVPLEGLPDPMVNRFSEGYREVWLYHHPLYSPGELPRPRPKYVGVDGAQGWFYGPVVEVDKDPLPPEEKRWLYALAGSLQEILENDSWEDFGAYIILGGIRTADTDGDGCKEENNTFNPVDYEFDGTTCVPRITSPTTDKPYVVLSSSRLPSRERDGYFNQEVLFFISEVDVGKDYGEEKLKGAVFYNIEGVRDAVNCQAYFSGTRRFPAPNYFQRMLEKPWEYGDEENGMFSFLVGEEFEDLPSIDFLYYKSLIEGCDGTSYYVAGLAGVKFPDMVEGRSLVNRLNLPSDVASAVGWKDLLTSKRACTPQGGGTS